MVSARSSMPYLAGAAVLALLAAACSTPSSSSSSAPGAAAQTGSATQAQGCPSSVNSQLAAAEAPVPLKIGPTLNASSLRGKKLWVIGIDNEQSVIADIQQGIDAAAKAAGMQVTNFDAQGLANKAVEGVSEAVANHPAGIIIDAINTKDIGGPLAAAQKAGIPVVSDYEPAQTPGTVTALVTDDASFTGRAQAALALSSTNCHTSALFIDSPIFSAQISAADATKSMFSQTCPQTCSTSAINYDPATLATTVGPAVSNAVQRNPKINVVLAETDDVAVYAVPALQAMSSPVKLVGGGGEQANLQFISKGQVQIGDVATPSNQFTGWITADQIFRLLLHQPQSQYDVIPQRLITQQNVGDGSASSLFPAFNNFEQKFLTAWGLG